MNNIQKIQDYIKRIFLRFQRSEETTPTIRRGLTFSEECLKNEVLYNSDPYELQQLFSHFAAEYKNYFWGKVGNSKWVAPRTYGMPTQIVDKFVTLSSDDLNDIKIDNKIIDDLVQDFIKKNDFNEVVEDGIRDTLIYGDGGFVIGYDVELDYPTLTFIAGDRVEYSYRKGKIYEVKVGELLEKVTGSAKKQFVLFTIYGNGYVKYELYTDTNIKIDLDELDETKGLRDIVFIKEYDEKGNPILDNEINLFIPLKFWKSKKFKHRGKSIFAGKEGNFNGLDECWTLWNDEMETNRTKEYVPKSFLNRDREGNVIQPKDYDNRYIAMGQEDSINENNTITRENGNMNVNAFEVTYNHEIQGCLFGIGSPSTWGLDTRTMSVQANTSYNSQIEKATFQTRNTINMALDKALKRLIRVMVCSYYYLTNLDTIPTIPEFETTIEFGDFESPSFDEVIGTITPAYSNGMGWMSLHEVLRQAYPNKTEEEIEEMYQEKIKEGSDLSNTMSDSDLFGLDDEMVEDNEVEEKEEKVEIEEI